MTCGVAATTPHVMFLKRQVRKEIILHDHFITGPVALPSGAAACIVAIVVIFIAIPSRDRLTALRLMVSAVTSRRHR